MAHNYISDGLATALAPILATVELILPTTTELQTEQPNLLPRYPDKRPFDISIQPEQLPDSATAPHCPFGVVGLDIVIPSTLLALPPLLTLLMYLNMLRPTNADVYHQLRVAEVETRWRHWTATTLLETFYERDTHL